MKKFPAYILFMLSFTLNCATSNNQTNSKLDFQIIDYGIVESETCSIEQQDKTSQGYITKSRNIKLVDKTLKIPARIGTKFGIVYIVNSKENISSNVLIKVKHPIFTKVNTGNNKIIEEWNCKFVTNKAQYSGYIFEHDYELVPGKWIIEVWYKNIKYIEKSFIIVLDSI